MSQLQISMLLIVPTGIALSMAFNRQPFSVVYWAFIGGAVVSQTLTALFK